MIQATERRRITDPETLRALVGMPSERAVRKQLAALDPHAKRFIERSPFVLLGTSGADVTSRQRATDQASSCCSTRPRW